MSKKTSAILQDVLFLAVVLVAAAGLAYVADVLTTVPGSGAVAGPVLKALAM